MPLHNIKKKPMASHLCNSTFLTSMMALTVIILVAWSRSNQNWTETSIESQFFDRLSDVMTHNEMYRMLFENNPRTAHDVTNERYLHQIRMLLSKQDPSKPLALQDYNKDRIAHGGGQTKLIDQRLGKRRNGFFVDCGGFDGDTYSNTLFLEMERNWTGLLIEPDPESYRKILSKNRRALALNGCLSPTRRSQQLSFMAAGMAGGIVDKLPHGRMNEIKAGGKLLEVKCFPFDHVMTALGISHVDYLNLDVEGPEVDILSTINFNQTRIDIMSVEMHGDSKKIAAMRELMASVGLYREVKMEALDLVYERIDLKV